MRKIDQTRSVFSCRPTERAGGARPSEACVSRGCDDTVNVRHAASSQEAEDCSAASRADGGSRFGSCPREQVPLYQHAGPIDGLTTAGCSRRVCRRVCEGVSRRPAGCKHSSTPAAPRSGACLWVFSAPYYDRMLEIACECL